MKDCYPAFGIIRALGFLSNPHDRFAVDRRVQFYRRCVERVVCRTVRLERARALGELAGQLRHWSVVGCGISRDIA
jgi:hypothetical protein